MAVQRNIAGLATYATSHEAAQAHSVPSARRGTACPSVPCVFYLHTTTIPSEKRLVQIYQLSASALGTRTFFSSRVALQDRLRGADWEGARGERKCGGVSCNGTYVRGCQMDMGAGGWVWAAARDRITRLVCWDIGVCKQGGGGEGVGCRARLKGRRLRWATCMSAVAHTDGCVLGCCACWQCSDADGVQGTRWDNAFSIEVAQDGSRR